jgi:hypothetical protein
LSLGLRLPAGCAREQPGEDRDGGGGDDRDSGWNHRDERERHDDRAERDGSTVLALEPELWPDYLLRVATASIDSYETFVSTRLGDVPGVDKLDSHITMKLIKPTSRQITVR